MIPADPETTKNLQKTLVEINTRRKQLETISDNLQKLLAETDAMLPEHGSTWTKHLEEYNQKAAVQLEKQQGITLTTEEKELLNDTNHANIEEQRSTLEKLGIKTPDSAFTINTLTAVVAAQSRNLQRIDGKSISKMIENLPVTKEEKTAAKEITTQYQKQHNELVKTAEELKSQATAIPEMPKEQLLQFKQLAKSSAVLSKAGVTLTEPTETVGQRLED